MTFNVISVRHEDLPSYGELVDALKACIQQTGQEKEVEFFSNALAVAKRPSIPILEVADYNTKGLTGPPNVHGTPFHSLLKSTGVSTKESETSGGSFGIGKNASFAVSELQTVLYATRYYDSDSASEMFAAQGKIKLVSHIDAQGQARRATGYWGDPQEFAAITDPSLVPEWMRRTQRGTSIFCLGFRESADWAEHMTSSLVTNFFSAIQRGEMVFEVAGGRFQINKNTIEALLNNPDIIAAAEKSGHLEDLEFASQLFRCLVSPNATEKTIGIDGLGSIRVRILTEAGMPRRVGFIRNGMLITNNLRHFGHHLMRFPGSKDFIALVEPAGAEAGKFLKRLENPAHDSFSAQRIADAEKRAAAETAMKQLGIVLRDLIRETTGVDDQRAVVLDELAKFFADSSHEQGTQNPDGENDPETHTFKPIVVKRAMRPALKKEDTGESGGGRARGVDGQPKGPSQPGPGLGGATGGRGNLGKQKSVHLQEFRNTIHADSGSRRLYFTPGITGVIRLHLQATGVNTPEPLTITSTDTGSVVGGVLEIPVTNSERVSVTVTFSETYDGPLQAYAVQESGGEK